MKQIHIQSKLWFDIVTVTQTVTSKWSPGRAVDFKGLNSFYYKYINFLKEGVNIFL